MGDGDDDLLPQDFMLAQLGHGGLGTAGDRTRRGVLWVCCVVSLRLPVLLFRMARRVCDVRGVK